MNHSLTRTSQVLVFSSIFVAILFLAVVLLPATASAAANIGLVSAQIATSSLNKVLVQLDNPNATTLTSVTAGSWKIDNPATTSSSAIILEANYPYTILLTFQGNLAASYNAADGLFVDASGVSDGTNSNAVVANTSSITIPAADSAAPTLSPVTVASNNASTTLAKSGDTVTVSFTSNKGIFTPGSTTTVGTHTATKTRTSPTVWTAATSMDSSDTDGSNVAFVLSGLKSIQGIPGANVTAVTSGANVIYDRTAPTISVISDAGPSAAYFGTDSYTDPGATVSDSREGTINSALVTSGSVNRGVLGTYTLTYNANDSAGNAATQVTRTVTVTHSPASNTGGIFTGSASSLPGYKPPRRQIIYPDGRVVYLDSERAAAPASAPASSSVTSYTRTLNVGASGEDVTALQTFLESRGFLTMPSGVPKGYFGRITRQAVMSYQQSVGIEAVGIVGPKTRAELNRAQ